jgi:hypothetical protein
MGSNLTRRVAVSPIARHEQRMCRVVSDSTSPDWTSSVADHRRRFTESADAHCNPNPILNVVDQDARRDTLHGSFSTRSRTLAVSNSVGTG